MTEDLPFQKGQISVSPPRNERKGWTVWFIHSFDTQEKAWEYQAYLQQLLGLETGKPPNSN